MISICFILFLLISILTSSYGQATCPSGWSQYGGSCYLINPAFNSGGPSGALRGTWDQCNAYCTASYPGATMLCVNNAAENDWIKQSGNHIWIGYTDMLPYGGGKGTKQYGWVTGCSSTYTNWQENFPVNYGGNADQAVVDPTNGSWYDWNSLNQLYCGCEYNSALTKTPSFRPSTVPSSLSTVAPSSGPTSSPTATPSFSSSQGDVSE